MRTDTTITQCIADAFRGWGTHLRSARTLRPVYQAEFQLGDGTLTNAAGFWLVLCDKFPKTCQRTNARNYLYIYSALRSVGIQRGTHRPQQWTGAHRGTLPQEPVEERGCALPTSAGAVPLQPPVRVGVVPRLSSVAARIRQCYDGLTRDGSLQFVVAGEVLGLDDFMQWLEDDSGVQATVPTIVAALRDRLPAFHAAVLLNEGKAAA